MTPEIKNAVYQLKKEVDEKIHYASNILLEFYNILWNLQVWINYS